MSTQRRTQVAILYGGPASKYPDEGPIVVYCDSDWAGDGETFHTRGGYVCTTFGSPVSWSSFKIKSVTASSCEAEYMAAAHAVRECIWLRYLLSDLGYGDLQPTQYSKLCGKDYEKERMLERCSHLEIPVMMCGDNKGCIAISKNPVLHKRSKHIHIAYRPLCHWTPCIILNIAPSH